MRVRRYALRTERAYCDWIRRYVKFHRMKGRADLAGGKTRVEAFLTHLAVDLAGAESAALSRVQPQCETGQKLKC
jgi:hypothetical protein